ncbi:MAG: hypothetical protein JWP57_3843 [Spirosoma sp.]|nr:hypothetical protein [Spirosoma sp.]
MKLVGQRLYVAGVCVSNRDYGMTTVEIEITGAISIPEVATLRPNGLNVIEWVNVKKLGHSSLR